MAAHQCSERFVLGVSAWIVVPISFHGPKSTRSRFAQKQHAVPVGAGLVVSYRTDIHITCITVHTVPDTYLARFAACAGAGAPFSLVKESGFSYGKADFGG